MLRVGLSTGGRQLEAWKVVLLRGSTLVRQNFAILDRKFGARWRVQKVAAHQSRADVDSGRLSRHEWLGNSKADEMARSERLGMRCLQVMSTPTERGGTRRLIWPISCLYICSSGEWSADAKSGRCGDS